MIVTIFANVCLLSLVAISFSSSALAAMHTPGASTVSPATTNTHQVAAPTDDSLHGCPLGYACIYPENAGWNNDQPSQKFYYFRTYQLSNQYGTHYVLNHQVGGASFWLCTDWNGNSCAQYVPISDDGVAVNLTPINSVKLSGTPDPTWQP
jgi:hypothetical protein